MEPDTDMGIWNEEFEPFYRLGAAIIKQAIDDYHHSCRLSEKIYDVGCNHCKALKWLTSKSFADFCEILNLNPVHIRQKANIPINVV